MYQDVTLLDNYGPFRKGETYKVYGTGRDYCKLKAKGHLYCVPFNMIEGGELWAAIVAGKPNQKSKKKKSKNKKQDSQSYKNKRQPDQ